ncbi:MAG: hypothetical protein K0V04_03325 [Deltaproteobacteria bacterium]|nr:hypothetical protein [Deltaproteobacteria bacterium]
MKTTTKIAITLVALATVASASSPVTAYAPTAFVQRTARFAEIADYAYCDGGNDPIDIGDVRFNRESEWDFEEVVRGYHATVGSTHHVLLNFCGTRTDSAQGVGDVLRDIQGFAFSAKAHNAWLGTSTNYGVGAGFQARARNYMESQNGKLRTFLDNRHDTNHKTVIHTVGHSLGGATSQLVSYYMSQYLADKDYRPAKFDIFNFAYNSPQSVGADFQAAFSEEARSGFFTPYSFLVKRDPVSTWATSYMNPIATGDLATTFDANVDKPAQLDNHLLSPDYIARLGSIGNWQGNAAATMASKYLPGCRL